MLVVHGLEVILVGAGNVIALDAEEELTFFYEVAEAGFDFDDAAGGERDDGDGAGDVGLNDSGDIEGGGGFVFGGSDERELVGMIDGEVVLVEIGDDLGIGRGFGFGVGLVVAGGEEES
jgi:hypothetical protein